MASHLEGDAALRRRLAAIGDTRILLGRVALLGVSEAKHIARATFTKTATLERGIRLGTVTDKSADIIATAGYSRYVEQGTGIYGPKGKPITPKRKKVLSWVGGGSRLTGKGPGSSRHFARSVRGRKATPYLVPGAKRAIERSGVSDTVITLWNSAA